MAKKEMEGQPEWEDGGKFVEDEPSPKDVLLEELKEAYPDVFQAIQEEGGECWTTDEVVVEFEIQGFMAPFCTAVRRETGEKGSLTFVHRPRIYYGWRVA